MFDCRKLHLSLKDRSVFFNLIHFLHLFNLKPILIFFLRSESLVHLHLVNAHLCLRLHPFLLKLSLETPLSVIVHCQLAVSLWPFFHVLLPLELLVARVYHLINVHLSLHLRAHYLSLKLPLPESYSLLLLRKFAAVCCYVSKFLLGILLDVGDILPLQVMHDKLVLVVFLIFHRHTLVKFILVALSLHLLNDFLQFKRFLSLYNSSSFLLQVIDFLFTF